MSNISFKVDKGQESKIIKDLNINISLLLKRREWLHLLWTGPVLGKSVLPLLKCGSRKKKKSGVSTWIGCVYNVHI